jgi:hypothetical protein
MVRVVADMSIPPHTEGVTVERHRNRFLVNVGNPAAWYKSTLTCEEYSTEIIQHIKTNYTGVNASKLASVINQYNLKKFLRLNSLFHETKRKNTLYGYIRIPIKAHKKFVIRHNTATLQNADDEKVWSTVQSVWYFKKISASLVSKALWTNYESMCSLIFATGRLRTSGTRRKMIYRLLPHFWK